MDEPLERLRAVTTTMDRLGVFVYGTQDAFDSLSAAARALEDTLLEYVDAQLRAMFNRYGWVCVLRPEWWRFWIVARNLRAKR